MKASGSNEFAKEQANRMLLDIATNRR